MAEKDLSVLVDTKLNMNHQRALAAKKASSCLGCIMKSISRRPKEVNLLLLSPGETHLQCHAQCWAPQSKRDRDILRCIHQRAMKMIKGLEDLTYKWRLRELRLTNLQHKRFRKIWSIFIFIHEAVVLGLCVQVLVVVGWQGWLL